MKRHSTDLASLVSGLVLLSVVVVWAIASSLDDLPGGWVLAAVLLLVGAAGLAGTLRRREPAAVGAGDQDPLPTGDPFGDPLGVGVGAPAGYTFPTGSPMGSPMGSPAGSPVGSSVGSSVGSPVAAHRVDAPHDLPEHDLPENDRQDQRPEDHPQDERLEDEPSDEKQPAPIDQTADLTDQLPRSEPDGRTP